MKDTNFLVRKAFYEALEGQLTYDGDAVEVVDEQASGTTPIYVVLSNQDSSEDRVFSKFKHDAFILLQVVHKTDYSASKIAVDNVANQICEIIKPTPSTNGLAAQEEFSFTSVKLESTRSFPFQLNDAETIVRRLLRFSIKIHEN